MLRKVFKTGNSVVVSLHKEALDLLGVTEGVNVSLELDPDKRQVILSPAKAPLTIEGIDETFTRQVADFIEQYRPALEALARF